MGKYRKGKSLVFAKRIVKYYRYLNEKIKETEMSKQILRCGTSSRTNVLDGKYAQSRKDSMSKLIITLKEAGDFKIRPTATLKSVKRFAPTCYLISLPGSIQTSISDSNS